MLNKRLDHKHLFYCEVVKLISWKFDLQKIDTCQCQTRECNNPPPQHGGESCTGTRVRVTNCTVHGGWTAWSAWSACSQTCGFAMKTRRRTCTNPAPAFGGRVCVGHDHDDIMCIDLPPCPVPAKATPPPQIGQWSTWGPWHACSKPCNGGEYPPSTLIIPMQSPKNI